MLTILICSSFLRSQECELVDTSLCRVIGSIENSDLAFEKKWDSENIITEVGIPYFLDIDGDCIPEIITIGLDHKNIIILNSEDGTTQNVIETVYFQHSDCPLAIADVDNDGVIEIIGTTSDANDNDPTQENRLICYNTNGDLEWITERLSYWHTDGLYSAPGLADFNQDGIPEVYIYDEIFNAQTGIKLIDGTNNGIGVGAERSSKWSSVIAADLDDDPNDLELAAGYTIYQISISNTSGEIGNSITPLNIMNDGEFIDGFTSIGDVDNNGKLDVIVSKYLSPSYNLYIYTLEDDEPILLSRIIINDLFGMSQVTGKVNINKNCYDLYFSGANKLFKYKYDIISSQISKCWEYTINDVFSITRVNLFDLNNDGVDEIVFRDKDSLSIFTEVNNNPVKLSSFECKSYTAAEYPVVSSFGKENETGICLSCFHAEGYYMTLFGAPDSTKWAPARPIWNQYNYHVLNINDDGTVPQFMKNNATYQNGRYNNFMTQASLLDSLGNFQQKAMNVFGAIQCVNYDAENDEYTVTFDLENRDDASLTAPVNMEVSFYSDNPEVTNTYLGTYQTLLAIPAGEALLDLEFTFPANNLSSLYMVINTTASGGGPLEDSLFTLLECDYSDNLVVSFALPEIVELDANICDGDTYDFYGTVLSDSGVYFENVKGSNGCDSVVTQLDLNITDTIMVSQSMETCDDYLWNDSTYTESGLYLYTTASSLGCDSIVSLDLIINYSTDMMDVQTACDSFFWNDIVYTESVVYTYESITSNGCDSVNILDLTILRSTEEEITHATCESYFWNEITYTESGTYTYETNNENGCDSTATLLLTINDTIAVTQSNSVCDSYTWNGNTYTESGSYPYETVSTLGCDSTITLELEVLSSTSSEDIVTSCDSMIWNGTTYFDSGTYDFSTINAVGCDSTATLDLTINSTSEELIEEMRCDSYSWNGTEYTESGIYFYPSTNQLGCDSVTILNLEINLSDNSTTTIEACDGYVWNDDAYTESGVYDFITVTTKGCDSIATLELTIYTKSETTVELSDCESITYNGEIIEVDGTYTYDFQSVHGCDSTIILVASILADKEQLEMTSCDTYTWDANGITYDESGSYSSTFQNIQGCDSILELDLTIQQSQLIEEMIDVCGSYYWPIIEDTITESGFYSETFLTQEGCDSIFELDIVVHPNYIHSDTIRATNEYTWEANNTTYTESGVYQLIYPSENLCDSIHILNLTINNSIEIVFPNVISFNGINNGFTAYGQTIELIESISVYDKWGSLLVRKENLPPNDPSLGWDGTYKGQEVAQGVYVFSCTILLKDGTKIMEYGDITVLR